jgi:hypothetical protein
VTTAVLGVMSLVTCLQGAPRADADVAPTGTATEAPMGTATEAPTEAPKTTPAPRRFVYAVMPGIVAGISPIPSIDIGVFLGARLRGGKWALGYQGTVTTGLADRFWFGLFTHRHHLAALTHFGRRGFATVGGGLALMMVLPMAEVEARVGARLGKRGRALFGVTMRGIWDFWHREKSPVPQLGLFAGFSAF